MVACDTGFPADSLEFCPSHAANDIFVCGTYKLDADKFSAENQRIAAQHRRGQCLVFQVETSDGVDSTNEVPYRKIQEFDLPAVLDMKWGHTQENAQPLLAVADSEGNITFHRLNLDEVSVSLINGIALTHSLTQRHLSQVERVQCTSPDTLCLSLDWANRLSRNPLDASLVVSLSNGSVCILRPTEASVSLSDSWHAHDHEPWIAAWNYWNTNVLYTGGDDLKLKTWDVRCGFDSPIYVNHRFDAGITSIQSNPHTEHLLAVGSYNNTVQLFDARQPLKPLVHADVGGGAWRVKWHPSATRKHDLVVASMRDGFKVVSFEVGDSQGEVSVGGEGKITKRFDEHTSLAYGVDWSFAPSGSRDTIIGSCSFYDHTLHLWKG
ncbi:Diphthamide biosynthesis protein 7 [Leucoagaricus sp. SymC.cos]|nr:Diphthamide biosynthesis protein 7 [Leucoagaricus sp. SymC.cos]